MLIKKRMALFRSADHWSVPSRLNARLIVDGISVAELKSRAWLHYKDSWLTNGQDIPLVSSESNMNA